MTEEAAPDTDDWRLRTLILLLLGASLGAAFDQLTDGAARLDSSDRPWRVAGASFVSVGGIVFAFALERVRWLWSAGFALAAAAVVALVAYWNGDYGRWGADEGWQFFAALLAVAIAVPLFQSVRDAGRWRLDRRAIHRHAWTNGVLWFAAWAFVLIAFLLALLLSELFVLIGIDALRDLVQEELFMWVLVGGALGASIGLLRDRDAMLGMIQRVAAMILAVLAPILALGLLIFVLALPFTGLAPLWEQTKSTTPILLSCILGAIVLANAVIGNAPEEEAKARPLRWGATALAAVMLPLALVAAASTARRIGQYGLTPDRLWACVFVAAAAAFALAYLVAVARGRANWPEHVRTANVRLALGLCLLALLLATPLADFGAISARDQLARLQAGRTSPNEFDWAAMAFDFGPSGRRALERLRQQGPPGLSRRAGEALASTERWDLQELALTGERADRLETELRVLPRPVKAPEQLRKALAAQSLCNFGPCTLLWEPSAPHALAIGFQCATCLAEVARFELRPGQRWELVQRSGSDTSFDPSPSAAEQRTAAARGQIELRPVQRRQAFLGGQPVGPVF